jgi:aromatic-L-amino-acid/L-tryptophan decarboxylase
MSEDERISHDDPLRLDPDRMRELGYRVVDLLADRLADPTAVPTNRSATREEMEARLHEPPPEAPAPFDGILRQLTGDVLEYMSRVDHPGYLAFIPGSGTWPAALGDFIAAATNVYVGSWLEGAGPTQLELTVLDWFKEWIGYPPEAAGILVGGGSAANMTALACAREALLGPMSDQVVAYVSDQSHSSLARSARMLGFRPDQVRVLPSDRRYRLRPDAIASAMDADVREGRRPLFVSASAGSTNTGAIDPLPELAALCRDRGVWLHVDAAYGGFATLTERGRRWLAGIELADSVTLDPHKWLYQPFECGSLLVRQGEQLRAAFEITPDYLRDVQIARREVNFADLGPQLSRTSRAIKVWMSLKFFGVGAFRAAIDRCLDLAAMAERAIESSPTLELMSPQSLGIVCFRRIVPGVEDEDVIAGVNADLMSSLNATGRAFISSTRLRGRHVLRLCVLNHATGPEDVQRVVEWIGGTPVRDALLRGSAPAPRREAALAMETADRDPDRSSGWLGRPGIEPGDLRHVPLFSELSNEELELVARSGRERTAAPGEPIIRQWDSSRDFFVLLEGTAELQDEAGARRPIEGGDFFGELAALDWGAGYGYARLATIVATSACRLLVIPWVRLNELVRDLPAVGERIRRAVRERLPSA